MRGHHIFETADGETEPFIEMSHPFRITLRVIIRCSYNVDALSGKCIKINWQGGNKRFSLTGCHLSNHAIVYGHPANELHVKMNHFPSKIMPADLNGGAAEAAGRVLNNGKRLQLDVF